MTDLAPLTGLTGITALGLKDTGVIDLSPLAGMTGITTLLLSHTSVTDLTPLTGMTGITTLSLSDTGVSDLTPLAGLTGITMLLLSHTSVTDITPLTGMTGITTLSLSDTGVSDLAPLAGLTGIRTLFLSNAGVTDLASLAGLTGISELWLNNNGITDLAPLAGLIGITALGLGNTSVTDLTPLTGLTGIKRLALDHCAVVDLRPVRQLPALLKRSTNALKEFGLTLDQCGASKADQTISAISKISDPEERAAKLFDYLADWVPPVSSIAPPKDLRTAEEVVIPPAGPMRFEDVSPDTSDEDLEDLRGDLVHKVGQLIAAIGGSNELAGLKDSAEHYQTQIGRSVTALKLRRLYSAANTLRVAYEAEISAQEQQRMNDYLPPRVAAPLKDLVETHALFYMSLPEAAAIHREMVSGLAVRPTTPDTALDASVVGTLVGDDKTLEPEDQDALRDDLAAARGSGPSAELGAISLRARLWNITSAIGRKIYWAAKTGSALVMSHDIIQWILGNQTVLAKWLTWAQGPGAEWFRFALEYLRKMI